MSIIKDFSSENIATWIPSSKGSVTLYLDVKDLAGNITRKEIKFIVNEKILNRPQIPMEDTIVSRTITSPTEICWQEDIELASYKLEYISRGEDINIKSEEEEAKEKYITISEGVNANKGAILGLFDTTLMQNGLYKVRLTGKDIKGNQIKRQAIYLVTGNMKAGNFNLSYEDMSIPLDGLPITIGRNYDSRKKSIGDFGMGWSLSLLDFKFEITSNIGEEGWEQVKSGSGFSTLYQIKETKKHNVTITYPTGEVEEFDIKLDPQSQKLSPIQATKMYFQAKVNSKATLKSLEDLEFITSGTIGGLELYSYTDGFEPTRFEYTDKNGIQYIINKNTGVEKVTYLDGDYVTINKDGLVYTTASGEIQKKVEIVRNEAGQIASISDFDGKKVLYEYDQKGNLSKVIDREGKETIYAYDSDNKLVSLKGFGGYIPAKYEYDDVTSKLKKEIDPLGYIFNYTYDSDGNLLLKEDPSGNKVEATYNRFGQVVTLKDANSNILTNTYSDGGLLTQIKDPYEKTINMEYNANEKPQKITNQLGKITQFTYDTKNNLKSMTDEAGNITNFVYDENGRCLSKSTEVTNGTIKEIVTVAYEYDKYGNIIKSTDSKNNSMNFQYKENTNELIKMIDRNGNSVQYKYDIYGNLIEVLYPDNTSETFTYDKIRNITSIVDANKKTTYFKYDRMNKITEISYPNGLVIYYSYNAIGELIKVKDSTSNETNYSYDASRRNTEIIDSLGNKTTFKYGSDSKVLEVIDANGNVIKYQYDKLGRRNNIIVGENINLSCTYDEVGRVTSQKDGEGNITYYEYDAVGNLTKVKNPLNEETSYKYNEFGNLVAEIDGNGNSTKYEYNNLGRVVSRTLQLGQKESYEYDKNGNIIKVTDFNGKTTQYIYNSKNLQTNKILSDGKETQYLYNANDYLIEVKDINGSIKYEYDDMGNLKVQTNPDGEKIEYSYDVLGNITLIKTPNTSTKYEYDKLGRIKKATDKEGLKAEYVYDKVGNLIKEDKGNNTNTTYEYDNLYRLKKLTNKKKTGEIISSYEYTVNNNGIRTKIVDDKGKIIDYSYDKVGKLLKESIRENGQLTDTSYDYDKVGNRLKKTTGSDIITYVYDSNNKLLTEGNISYTYDCGNLIKKESPSEKIEYTYNLDGKLSNTKRTVGATVTNESYYYNALGTRIKKVTNGLEEKYLVDENTSYSRVLEEKDKDNKLTASYLYGNELISQNRSNIKSFYNRDGLGSTVSLCNSTGNVTDTYKYDGFGNLKVSTGTTKNNYLFAGEEFDKTTGYYNLRARYMDPSTGRFTGMDK